MSEIYQQIIELKRNGKEGVLITVVDKEGHGPAVIGSKMLLLRNDQKFGTVGGGALEFAASSHAGQILDSKKSGMQKYLLNPDNELIDGLQTGMLCGGAITLFFEYIGCGPKLYIFGAGHIGHALAYHLKNMDYFIHLLDCRPGMVEAIPFVHRRTTADYENILSDEEISPDSFFIIASHSHALDYVILKRIYQADWHPQYIGLIASKRKSPLMIERLKQELGADINLEILYTPLGLDTGGQSPDEIAISIIAELQVIRYHKTGHKHMKLK